MTRVEYYSLLAALLVGLSVRIPGILWGYDFPGGWRGHHIDEYPHLQNTISIMRPWAPQWMHPYPKGMAAHVAIPLLVKRALAGELHDDLPAGIHIIVAGRVVGVLYGAATILLVFLLAKRLFRDRRVAHFAAWIMALGGLHVSQSHFFLSDVPSIFWFLLGSYLLFFEHEQPGRNNALFLVGAAFSFGVAFGLKLSVFVIPTLYIIAITHQPRIIRGIYASVFFSFGFALVNFGSYTAYDIAKTVFGGIRNPYQVSSWAKLIIYLIELPSIVSFPLLLLFLGGSYFLLMRFVRLPADERFLPVVLIVLLPLLINSVLTMVVLSQFPRHLITFIPWICMVSAWSLVHIMEKASSKGVPAISVAIAFLVYLALFVFDGERVFLNDPRAKAARWIHQNVPPGYPIYWRTPGNFGAQGVLGHKYVDFPLRGRPPVLVIQMDDANRFLSGMGLRDSYPNDYRQVFDAESQKQIEDLQAVFKGTSEYREVARFPEGYFMPEYTIVDRLIGNRSRNYVSEIAVFTRTADHKPSGTSEGVSAVAVEQAEAR
jgi:MFS family permease